MIDHVAVAKIALACRRGLHSLNGASGSMFADFPVGACDSASQILGRLLKERLGYDGASVCGTEHANLPSGQSHVWFEVADILIDITHDQFDGTGLSGWTFTGPTRWHAQFALVERRCGFYMPSAWQCYPHDGYYAVLASLCNV